MPGIKGIHDSVKTPSVDPNLDQFAMGPVRLDFDKYPNGINPAQVPGMIALLDMLQHRLNRDFASQSPEHVTGINDEMTQLRGDITNLYYYRCT